MSVAIGIDLGTSNSCVAAIVDGQTRVLTDKTGRRTQPSVVAFGYGGATVVGHRARQQLAYAPETTIHSVKRLIGRRYKSMEIEHVKRHVAWGVVEGPHGDARIRVQGKLYTPQEISGHVLAHLKKLAEEALGQPVTQAVVTVPAYFNDQQRQATRDAATIAGLECLRILNEPTAAALAYGFGKSKNQHVAVYDLGGGTFDVSILRIDGDVFEVIATAGDTYLGGDDFDALLVEHLYYELGRESKVDLREDPMVRARLRDAAEQAKMALSTVDGVDVRVPTVARLADGRTIALNSRMDRHLLKKLTWSLVERTMEVCKDALSQAGLAAAQIDKVLLVGGMTRAPFIQEAVSLFFHQDVQPSINPDEAVAIGAAIQAHNLTTYDGEIDSVLLDVTPQSLGIRTLGGFMDAIIPRNTPVPSEATKVFHTANDNQASVRIQVLQGESRQAADNNFLGDFVLDGLPPGPRGAVRIEVRFAIDADGIVHVSARDLSTGREQGVRIEGASGLTASEVDAMRFDEIAP